ncbi:tetratricopeptide repeat protein [candidate division KSB1 bacterium]|nr:tetratricopeptide repeat protein [candidate division KSB1 bacterium]
MRSLYLLKQCIIFIIIFFLITGFAFFPKQGDKIPITTSTDQALKLFLKGRDISERLQIQESRQYFEKAVQADPDFAMAHLFLAFAQPTAQGFFNHLNKAVELSDNASKGEQLWILGIEAGVNGLPMKQRENYQKLVAAYPNDERAHNLLGIHYFGQQEWEKAIDSYKKAIEINPDFSQPYNQLGYAYRFLSEYDKAEKVFQKYIQLIPNDPNPYDSYAELLLKIGKYEKSIENYKKALEINPNFVASHIGIATNLNYMDKHEQARQQLQKLAEMARTDGELRAAHFSMAVSYADAGNLEKALSEIKAQYSIAEKTKDAALKAADLNTMGIILLHAEKYDKAAEMYKNSVKLIRASDLSPEVKKNAERIYLANSARVAIMKNNIESAKTDLEKFHKAVEAVNNPLQMMLYHELMGMAEMSENNFDMAIAEYKKANQQNPYNLYRLAMAYKAKGNKEMARKYFKKAATFNALNNLNQCFIRNKAKAMIAEM